MAERGLSNGVQAALLLPLAFSVLLGLLQWSLLLWAEAGARGAAGDIAWDAASLGARGTRRVSVDGLTSPEVDVRQDGTHTVVTVSGEAIRVVPFVDVSVAQKVRVPTERLG